MSDLVTLASAPATLGRATARLRPARRGMVAIELALLLSLVLGAVLLGAMLLGQAQHRSFQQVAARVDKPTEDDATMRASKAGSTDRDASRQKPTGSDPRFSAPLESPAVLVPLTAVLLLVLAIAWWSVRRTRLRQASLSVENEATPENPLARQAAYVRKRQQILRLARKDAEQGLQTDLRIKHVMTPDVPTASPQASIPELVRMMELHQVQQIVIRGPQGKPLGIVSQRGASAGRGRRASDIMWTELATVTPEMELSVAITILLERQVSCLLVMDQQKLLGLVTSDDLVMTLQVLMQLVQQMPSEALV